VDVHASISALTFFNVSNQYSFGQIFKRDTSTPAARALRQHRETMLQGLTNLDRGIEQERPTVASRAFRIYEGSLIRLWRSFSPRRTS
jgi:hypothetical protein